MSGLWPIFKRELFSLFVTPLAWVLGTAFLLLQGMHFYLIVSHFAAQSEIAADAGPVETFFGQTVLLYLPLLFVCPVLTMRLFAEERRAGTVEVLMTAPVTHVEVVLSKFFAAFTFLLMAVTSSRLLSGCVPIMTVRLRMSSDAAHMSFV